MDGSRHKLFACSRFTRDQNCGISWRNFGNDRENGLQSRGGSDNLLKHRSLINLFTESGVLLLQFILVSLAILDVGTCDVPPNDLSLVVSERVVTDQHPTIRCIAATQALLHLKLVGGAAGQRTLKMCLDPVNVVRMNFIFMASQTPLVEADAVISERHSVRVQPLELGPQYADELWREVQHLTEFLLALAPRLSQFLLLGYVDPGADESSKRPAVSRGGTHATYMTNLSIWSHDTLREVECSIGRQRLLNL